MRRTLKRGLSMGLWIVVVPVILAGTAKAVQARVVLDDCLALPGYPEGKFCNFAVDCLPECEEAVIINCNEDHCCECFF
jgi:hypothetical protein